MKAKGYRISKDLDCNALTFFIDEKKRALCLGLAWRKDTIYDIPMIYLIKRITIGDVEIHKKK